MRCNYQRSSLPIKFTRLMLERVEPVGINDLYGDGDRAGRDRLEILGLEPDLAHERSQLFAPIRAGENVGQTQLPFGRDGRGLVEVATNVGVATTRPAAVVRRLL